MWVFNRLSKRISAPRVRQERPQTRLVLEALEARFVPYALTGNSWVHPEMVTISFVPDGTNLGGVTSNLFSKFNARFGTAAAWQNQILSAAQSWGQQTNINFVLVSDNGAGTGTGSYQQGDPGFGDIRIGGYSMLGGTLASANFPPQVNNFSLAGDVSFNSSLGFNINGMDYDLYTVALHEFGHALGLGHSANGAAVMVGIYTGLFYGPAADDTSGIRNIYSGNASRSADSYDAVASNGSFATATDVTSLIDPSTKIGLVNTLDVTTTSDVDYYKVTALAGSSTLKVQVQSTGLSLLRPLFKVYNAGFTQIANVTSSSFTGDTLSTTVSVSPGQVYYVMVDGAVSTAHGTGKYALALNFGAGATPVAPSPNTQTLNGTPLSGGGGLASHIPRGNQGQDEGSQDEDEHDVYSDTYEIAPGYYDRRHPVAPESSSRLPTGAAETLGWDVTLLTSSPDRELVGLWGSRWEASFQDGQQSATIAFQVAGPNMVGASPEPGSPAEENRAWRAGQQAYFNEGSRPAFALDGEDWAALFAR